MQEENYQKILKSKAITEIPISTGDMVEIYSKKDFEKRGQWSIPKKVLSVDQNARIVTVAGKNGKSMNVAFEDLRQPVLENQFDQIVQSAIDNIDENNEKAIENLENQNGQDNTTINQETQQPETQQPEPEYSNSDFENISNSDMIPNVGDKVEVYWPLDNTYYPGTIESEQEDGKLSVAYDDGDMEILNFSTETWKYQINNNNSSLKVKSIEQDVLKKWKSILGTNSL